MLKHFSPFLLLSFWTTTIAAQFNTTIIDSLGELTLNMTGTNGAYLSIIKNNAVVYSSAFGYNDAENNTVLTDSTIFPISSNTKAFNSILLTQLAEEKLLDFDLPLINYLPELEFSSSFITNEITLMDLLTHRLGIPRYDFTYYVLDSVEKKAPNQAVFNKLKYLETTSSFRTRFQYGNNQYIVAAYLLEQLTGDKWEERLDEKILLPLGMQDTHCDLEVYKASSNTSKGYQQKQPTDIDLVAPLYKVSGMGNMFSSICDLEKWSRFLLEGDTNLLAIDWLRFNQQGHFVVGFEEPYQGFSNIEYGLGWFVFDYFGSKVVLHHGDNIGHQSLMVLLPDDNISFQLMGNEGMTSKSFCFRMAFSLLDMVKLDTINDWNARRASSYVYQSVYTDSLGVLPPTIDLSDYEGNYKHKGFGNIHIGVKNGALHVNADGIKGTLAYWKTDTFVLDIPEFQEAYLINFKRSAATIIGLETDMVDLSIQPIFFPKE